MTLLNISFSRIRARTWSTTQHNRKHPKKGRETPISGWTCQHKREPPSGSRDWRHYQWKGQTRENIAHLPVVHARTQGNPFGVTWLVTSGSHGTCTTFCTTIVRKKARGKSGHAQNMLPWRHFWYLHLLAPPPQMWFCPYPYTTNIYIYVWKLNQTVLELDFWAVKFLFFPRRDLNSHHWYTAAPFA
jgi:hypothetical protein